MLQSVTIIAICYSRRKMLPRVLSFPVALVARVRLRSLAGRRLCLEFASETDARIDTKESPDYSTLDTDLSNTRPVHHRRFTCSDKGYAIASVFVEKPFVTPRSSVQR